MKRIIYSILVILFTSSAYSQEMPENLKCYSLSFVTKDSVVDPSQVLPVYQEHGFLLIRNGVYDFIIDGKKYYQAVLISLDSSSFYISSEWKFEGDKEIIKDSVLVTIDQDIRLRVVTIDNGVTGLPVKASRKQYFIDIIDTGEICGIKNAAIDNGFYIEYGHFYFTWYGWKKVKIIDENPYMVENNQEYLLRRK